MKRRTINTRPLNTAVANSARIFDFLLGGTANFDSDRQVAEKLLLLFPSTRKWIRLHRAFVQEAALQLRETGIRQFLDLASGLPTQDHIHAVVPDARVLYSDANPIAVSYGGGALAGLPDVHFHYADPREVADLLTDSATEQLFDREKPIAIGLNATPNSVNLRTVHEICQTLYAWAPPGSKLFFPLQCQTPGATTPAYRQVLEIYAAAGLKLQHHSLDAIRTQSDPWQVETQLPIAEFLKLPTHFITPDDGEGIGLQSYAVILAKT